VGVNINKLKAISISVFCLIFALCLEAQGTDSSEKESQSHSSHSKSSENSSSEEIWFCESVDDSGSKKSDWPTCQKEGCGTKIRYVHNMINESGERLGVGCCCAKNMEDDSERAGNRQHYFINKQKANWKSLSKVGTYGYGDHMNLCFGNKSTNVYANIKSNDKYTYTVFGKESENYFDTIEDAEENALNFYLYGKNL
jgi:hypothetical protein